MAAVELHLADVVDAELLAANLRPADREELRAAHGDRPALAVIIETLALTPAPRAAWSESGRLICLFGVAPIGPLLTPLAAPWLLATPLLPRHAVVLIRETRRYLAEVRDRYPLLLNFVDARNTASIRYLRAVGFTLDDPMPFGAAGLPFHRFHMGLAD